LKPEEKFVITYSDPLTKAVAFSYQPELLKDLRTLEKKGLQSVSHLVTAV